MATHTHHSQQPDSKQPAPDTTRRSERSRRAIYDAALDLVTEVGYPKTTIEGIAARAGVGKQTIYRWWSSKAEVLMEAFLDLSEQAAREAGPEPAYAIPDTGDLAADLKAVLRLTVDQLKDPRFEALPRPGRRGRRQRGSRPHLRDQAPRTVAPAVRRPGARRPAGRPGAPRDRPAHRPRTVGLPLAQRWLQYTGPISYDYTDTLVDYALHGIAPR